MRKNYAIIFVFLCLLIPSLVSAEVDEAKGFEWLNKTMVNQNWNRPNIDEIAISILALRNAGYDVSKGVDKLLARKTGNNWQGNYYDTAWATLALYKEGYNIDRYVSWLQENDRKAYSDGNWLIQILTEDSGACMVEDENGNEYGPFTIDGTKVVSGCPANDRWIDVGACVIPTGIDKYHSLSIYCDPSITMSNLLLLYKRNNDYYLIDDSNPLELENACYGTSSCDCGNSGYTTWALEYLNKGFRTSNYLETACDNTPLQKAMLYEITEKEHYAAWLKDHQQFGQYGGNYYDTAFVIGSLKQGGSYGDAVTSATSYLGNRQNPEGWWNNDHDIKTTAMILWRVFSTDLPPGTPEDPVNCNFDGMCDPGETYLNCPSDCNATNVTGNGTGYCNNDGILDPGIGEECDAIYDENNSLISGNILSCDDDQKCVDCTCQDVYDGPNVNNTVPEEPDPSEACTSSDECASDTDCSWLGICYYCDGFTCSCKEDQTCCETDDDCDYYLEECDVSINTCISKSSEPDPDCETDSDCSSGYICELGDCVAFGDEDEPSGSKLWIWILVLVLVIGGAAFYFFFMKKGGKGFSFGGKGKKKQTFDDFLKHKKQQDQRKKGFKPGKVEPAKPYYPKVKKVREDKFEKELDDSIKKARDLLRKK